MFNTNGLFLKVNSGVYEGKERQNCEVLVGGDVLKFKLSKDNAKYLKTVEAQQEINFDFSLTSNKYGAVITIVKVN